MNKRATLRDVAKAAGVSAMSVSKALNNKGGVSEETAKRILETARRLNYQPNMVAKGLRLDETKTLGVVVSDSSEMVMSKILRGIADKAEELGYNIIIANTDRDCDKERHAVQVLINKCIDGLLIVASTLTASYDIEWLQSFRIPVALLMRESPFVPIDTVINDNFSGGYQIAKHLTAQGCKNFCFLMLSSVSQSGEARLKGNRKALEECGVPFDPDSVIYTHPFIQDGYKNMKKMLRKSKSFDAVVCGCDLIAVGAMEALFEAGISVPEQVRIGGYDDIELAGYLRVPLTTMRQPLYQIGQEGVRLIVERIRSGDTPARHIMLSSELVVRASTK